MRKKSRIILTIALIAGLVGYGVAVLMIALSVDEETWNGYGRAWDVRLIENKPKPPVGRKYYEHWEDMEEF